MIDRMKTGAWKAHTIGAVIALQVAVPLVAFLDEPPTRFGFQMYSGLGSTEVDITARDGRPVPFDHQAALAGLLRPEFDWTQRLPEYVCANVPEAHKVAVRQTSQRRTVICD